jgi:hypothetical protein
LSVYNGTAFLAVDAESGFQPPTLFWLSTSGMDWRLVESSLTWANGVEQLATWRGQFVVAGVDAEGPNPHATLWQSADGATWQPLPDSPSLAFFEGWPPDAAMWESILGLTAEETDLVVTGLVVKSTKHFRSAVAVVEWRSSDGVSWTRRQLPLDILESWYSYSDPIAIGDNWVRYEPRGTEIEVSSDKRSWRRAWPPEYLPNLQVTSVAETKWGLVAVGGSLVVGEGGSANFVEAVALNSTDGMNWVESSGWPDLDIGLLMDVTSSDSAIVAVGAGAKGLSDVDEAGNPQKAFVWVSRPPGTP